MTITLTIDPSVETETIQNVALAMGLNDVTDEEARVALGNAFKKQTEELAKRGQTTRERQKELEETEQANKLISVA